MSGDRVLQQVESFDTADHRGRDVESVFLHFTDRFGRAVRVYAARCVPDSDTPLAGVLHLPGGSQTVNPQDLWWWAEQGFAAYSLDWENGEFPQHDPDRKSVWPDAVRRKGDALQREEQAILPLAIRAASAVMDWMADDPRVDATRLGVTGISWGGYLTWPVAAHDDRVRAIVPVFGCGGMFDPRHTTDHRRTAHAPAMRELWQTQWDALALADRIRVPTCFLSSTNDFWGIHTIAEDLLASLPQGVDLRRSSVPNHNHHTGAALGATAAAWMRHHLADGPPLPREPVLLDDFTIDADTSLPVAAREVWWTPSVEPDVLQCWWPGPPPTGEAALVLGRVHYANGVVLNTPTRMMQPTAATPVPAVWPDAVDAGASVWWGVCSTQFYEAGGPGSAPPTRVPVDGDRTRCRIITDRDGAGRFSYSFRGLGDPRWNDGSIDRVRLTIDGDGQPLSNIELTFIALEDGFRRQYKQPIATDPGATRVELDLCPREVDDLPSGIGWPDVYEIEVCGDVAGPSYVAGPIVKC